VIAPGRWHLVIEVDAAVVPIVEVSGVVAEWVRPEGEIVLADAGEDLVIPLFGDQERVVQRRKIAIGVDEVERGVAADLEYRELAQRLGGSRPIISAKDGAVAFDMSGEPARPQPIGLPDLGGAAGHSGDIVARVEDWRMSWRPTTPGPWI
jgi:hypothetical protein